MFSAIFSGLLTIGFGWVVYLTYTAQGLPGPEEGRKISMRNESRGGVTRRSHFYSGGYIGGK